MTGFPKWGRLVGDNLGKMAENCMEIRKSMFWGQNSVRDMGDKTVFQVVGGDPAQSPSLGEIIVSLTPLGVTLAFL